MFQLLSNNNPVPATGAFVIAFAQRQSTAGAVGTRATPPPSIDPLTPSHHRSRSLGDFENSHCATGMVACVS